MGEVTEKLAATDVIKFVLAWFGDQNFSFNVEPELQVLTHNV